MVDWLLRAWNIVRGHSAGMYSREHVALLEAQKRAALEELAASKEKLADCQKTLADKIEEVARQQNDVAKNEANPRENKHREFSLYFDCHGVLWMIQNHGLPEPIPRCPKCKIPLQGKAVTSPMKCLDCSFETMFVKHDIKKLYEFMLDSISQGHLTPRT